MDWGKGLTPEQLPPRPATAAVVVSSSGTKPEKGGNGSDMGHPTEEKQMIRLGALGKGSVAPDDDVIILIAPQNMIGASVMGLLEEMVQEAAGRPMILINPILGDRPSSNNVMQIRGRENRRELQDSFVDIFAFRLLYPSSGGYMYPIRGAIFKRSFKSPWLLLDRKMTANNVEKYEILAALPSHPPPDPNAISTLFLQN